MNTIKKILTIPFFLTGILNCGTAQNEKTDSIYSNILKGYRSFSIGTPANYSKSKDSCAVLFLLDGNIHSNYVSASVNYLSEIAKTTPHILVIGINQEDRFRELGFTPDIIMQQECHAKEFSEFIIKELSPYIESKYRVYPYKILAGHSLSGNFVLYNFMYSNNFYNAFLAVSPDFTRDTILLTALEKYDYTQTASNTVLYTIHEKYLFPDKQEKQIEYKGLVEKFGTNFQAKYDYDENVNHLSITPIGFITGINYIFKDYFLPKEIVDNEGLPGIIAHYAQVEKQYGIKIKPDYDLLLNVAYSISFKDNKGKEALEIIDYCMNNYSENYMTHWVKGEIYLNMNEKEKALINLKKASELNPGAIDLQERIKIIETNSH